MKISLTAKSAGQILDTDRRTADIVCPARLQQKMGKN
jgi:hypothetical protein